MSRDRISQSGYYIKLSLFGAALSVLWPSLHTIIIPLILLQFVPEAQKNTYLGILVFTGMALALLVQPLAGTLSDRLSSRFGKRRPFILVGTLLALVILPSVGFSGTFPFLFIGYCLLQCACNVAQGPFQGFIPDLVAQKHRGTACGVKSFVEILASVALLRVVAYFMDIYSSGGNQTWLWLAIGFPGIILLGAMLATIFTVKEQPASPVNQPFSASTIINTYKIDVKNNPGFVWFLVSRLFIMMALGTLQSFALYFLKDVIHIPNPAGAAANLLITIGIALLVAVYPAGWLSDKFGRKPIILFSGLVGAIGILVLIFARSYSGVIICGSLLGISAGAFLSANWALATDLVPPGEEARYLGLTNIATAGAGALARLIGPVIDFFNTQQSGLGYSIMLMACVLYFVLGSASVIPIKEKTTKAR